MLDSEKLNEGLDDVKENISTDGNEGEDKDLRSLESPLTEGEHGDEETE